MKTHTQIAEELLKEIKKWTVKKPRESSRVQDVYIYKTDLLEEKIKQHATDCQMFLEFLEGLTETWESISRRIESYKDYPKISKQITDLQNAINKYKAEGLVDGK